MTAFGPVHMAPAPQQQRRKHRREDGSRDPRAARPACGAHAGEAPAMIEPADEEMPQRDGLGELYDCGRLEPQWCAGGLNVPVHERFPEHAESRTVSLEERTALV